MEGDTPRGYCHCGCGQKTEIASYTDHRRGFVKGEPKPYVFPHRNHPWRPPNPSGICQCGCGQLAPIAKRTNLRNGNRKGEVARFLPGHYARKSDEQRFWENVHRGAPDECWGWEGQESTSNGYGRMSRSGNGAAHVLAHRFAYELFYGPIPDGMLICHRCDNRLCCNPAHLFRGTYQDNVDDMVAKGRAAWQHEELRETND